MRNTIVPLALCLALAACSEATRIHTTPPGAMVRINGRELGPAPVDLKVKSWSTRPNAYHYHVEMPGYVPKEGYIQPHLSVSRIIAAAFSSCFTCSFHGFYEFDDETEIVLQPEGLAPPDDPVAVQLRRLQRLYEQGLINADELQRYRNEILRDLAPSRARPGSIPDMLQELIAPLESNVEH